MIRLATLYADRLNLNGDQGNLRVLEKRLLARNIEFDVVQFKIGDDPQILNDVDFLLIGHGSLAAWRSLESDLHRVSDAIQQILVSNTLVLAVSSGAEMLYRHPIKFFEENLEKVPRRSRFVIAAFEGKQVLGYVNSETSLPDIKRTGSVIVTTLHGPLLAKNPQVADSILESFGAEISSSAAIEKLDESVAGIWSLETELANE